MGMADNRVTGRLDKALQKLANDLQKKGCFKKYDKVMV
jgi:hypothetical protein